MSWVLAGAAAGLLIGGSLLLAGGLGVVVLGAGIGLGAYLISEAIAGKTPTWQGAAASIVTGAVLAVAGPAAVGLAEGIVGEGLVANVLGGVAVGMLGGAVNEELYNGLNGRSTSDQQLAESMAVGAVFGFAGGFGEYGASEAEGLGFGRGFDKAADGVFNLVLGGFAGATGERFGLG